MFVTLCVVAAMPAHVLAQSPTQASDLEARQYTPASGTALPYRLYTPKNYDASQNYPLILFLHGVGERGSDNVAQINGQSAVLQLIRDDFPAFFVAPQAPTNDLWTNVVSFGVTSVDSDAVPITGSLDSALNLVDALRSEFSIASDRLYITGLSMGGFGTWDALVRRPNTFAAAVPICGAGDPDKGAIITGTDVWAFHAADDTVVPVQASRNMIQSLTTAGASPLYTEYPVNLGVGHFSWIPAYGNADLAPWLFAQSLAPANTGVPEPGVATFGFVTVAGVSGLMLRARRRRQNLVK